MKTIWHDDTMGPNPGEDTKLLVCGDADGDDESLFDYVLKKHPGLKNNGYSEFLALMKRGGRKRSSDISDEEYALRKIIGLPVTKTLRYMQYTPKDTYIELPVVDFWVVDQYSPGDYSLMIILESGREIRIFAPYFVQMQAPSFVEDMKKESCDL